MSFQSQAVRARHHLDIALTSLKNPFSVCDRVTERIALITNNKLGSDEIHLVKNGVNELYTIVACTRAQRDIELLEVVSFDQTLRRGISDLYKRFHPNGSAYDEQARDYSDVVAQQHILKVTHMINAMLLPPSKSVFQSKRSPLEISERDRFAVHYLDDLIDQMGEGDSTACDILKKMCSRYKPDAMMEIIQTMNDMNIRGQQIGIGFRLCKSDIDIFTSNIVNRNSGFVSSINSLRGFTGEIAVVSGAAKDHRRKEPEKAAEGVA